MKKMTDEQAEARKTVVSGQEVPEWMQTICQGVADRAYATILHALLNARQGPSEKEIQVVKCSLLRTRRVTPPGPFEQYERQEALAEGGTWSEYKSFSLINEWYIHDEGDVRLEVIVNGPYVRKP